MDYASLETLLPSISKCIWSILRFFLNQKENLRNIKYQLKRIKFFTKFEGIAINLQEISK